MQEKVIEIKQCNHCTEKFEITDKDLEFYEKISPIFAGKKYIIPTPKICPDCRQQRRLSFRNERKLYKRKCDFSGKDIISIYSPDKKYKVYDQKIWWSDKWDSMDYGKSFDFNKTFFEQFDELMKEVPKLPSFATQNENSLYVNGAAYSKNCYLIFASDHNQNSFYSDIIFNCSDICDSSDSTQSNTSYEIIGCKSCSRIKHSINCYDSDSLEYCFDCKGCKFCFLSSGLHNKSYYFLNKSYSKSEYLKLAEEHKNKYSTFELYQQFMNLKKQSFHLAINGSGNENSSGDSITNCKNSFNIFSAHELIDCKYIINGNTSKTCRDSYVLVDNSTLSYENVSSISITKCCFTFACWNTNVNLLYCDHCQSSQNLFGCIGLRNKSYCILNKQYTKEEYEELVPKIIEHMISTGEWGEFFPSSISPFGYNETVANEYFPLTKEEAINLAFNWSDYEPPFPKVDKIIKAEMLPENIIDIPDDILNWAIECEVTKKPFRIIKQELEFYRKHNLPIPKRHPDQRHLDRMSLRNPRKLFDRKCDKCGIDIKTTYSPDRKEVIYCESCYEKEIY